MSTIIEHFLATRRQQPGVNHRYLSVPFAEGALGYHPAALSSQLFNYNMAQIIGGGMTPNLSTSLTVPGFSVTTGGTADATAYSTTGGLLMTLASDDNFDMTLDSSRAFTPTSGRWYFMLSRFQVSAITGEGFFLGFTTGAGDAALPFGTEYTDCLALKKAIASGDVYGRARGNSGTAVSTAAKLGTMVNDTEIEAGLLFYLHASNPQGYYFYNGAITEFSATQKTQLGAVLTTPPTMYATIHGTGVTGTNPTITVTSFLAGEIL